jgi:hypothetical protein
MKIISHEDPSLFDPKLHFEEIIEKRNPLVCGKFHTFGTNRFLIMQNIKNTKQKEEQEFEELFHKS